MNGRRGRRLPGWAAVALVALAAVVGCEYTGGFFGSIPPFSDTGESLIGLGSSSSVAWGDYDSDGDLDLALAGAWHDGDWHEEARVYQNDAGNFYDIGAGLTGVSSCSLAWGDWDNDGYVDLALAGAGAADYVAQVYRNNGNGTFSDIDAGLPGLGYMETCCLAWGDYDNDGDLDLALAGWSSVSGRMAEIFRNNGDATFADMNVGFPGVAAPSLAWGDYDGDGDLDLLLTGSTGSGSDNAIAKLYENSGGAFAEETNATLTGVMRSSAAWGDYDGDGDLDLALLGRGGLGLMSRIYRNEGSGTFANVGAGLADVSMGEVAWGDYDNDGDLDLALAGSDDNRGLTKVYRNEGGEAFIDIGAGLKGLAWCSLAWGDYDGDGDLDLVAAGQGDNVGSFDHTVLYRNNCLVSNTRPDAPTGLSSTPASGEATFSWTAATDAETPSLGLTYNLRVGTASGSDDVMPAMADLTTGERRIPAMGNVQHNTQWTLNLPADTYYWSVQAIDTAFEGSPWAPEETVTVP